MRSSIVTMAAALALACGPIPPGDTTAGSTTDATGSAGSTSDATGTPTTGAPTTGTPTTGAPTTGTSTGAAGSTGPTDPAVCAAAKRLEITSAKATPIDGPTWSPGEAVTIEAVLRNPGPEDFTDYPGIRVTADRPDVTAAMGENWLFALLAGMENSLPVTFTAAPAAAPGAVTFTIEIVVLNDTCPDLARTELAVSLAPA